MFEHAGESAGPNWKLWLLLIAILVALVGTLVWILRTTHMPLKSFTGQLAPLTSEEAETSQRLSQHVQFLSETVGERNLLKAGTLEAAADYLRTSLEQAGYAVTEQSYSVQNHQVRNLEVKLVGSKNSGETVVVGAHYDSVQGSPGANDNASGVAAVLELAHLLRGFTPRKTIRFVLFVNEEAPYFQTESMGSVVYAKQLHADQVPVSAMISLETIGYYSDAQGSQKYPDLLDLLYPKRGNFIGFVGNPSSRGLLHAVVRRFRETTRFPSEGIAAPEQWSGVGWSDHWSFWQENYPAIMVTDTAPFRYPYYHTAHDTANHVDFARMSRVVCGVRRVVESLSAD